MYLSSISLVSLTLILFRLYRLTTEWDKSTSLNDLLRLDLNEVESVLSHIDQKNLAIQIVVKTKEYFEKTRQVKNSYNCKYALVFVLL